MLGQWVLTLICSLRTPRAMWQRRPGRAVLSHLLVACDAQVPARKGDSVSTMC